VEGAALGGGPAPSTAVTPVAPARAPAFGARTNVSRSLTHARIRARARLRVTVRTANTFAIRGSLTDPAGHRRRPTATLTVKLAHAHRPANC
jgi:hypothetical protein